MPGSNGWSRRDESKSAADNNAYIQRNMREEDVMENNIENGGKIHELLVNMLQQTRKLYENEEK